MHEDLMRPECHGGRNLHLRSEPVLDLMDHESILGHVVDAAGWNIQVRDCLLGKQEPHEPHPERLQRAWHFDYEEEWFGTTHDGLLPMLEFKVSWYISDHTVAGHGMTLVVPASSNAPSRIHSRRRGV